jgi:hypothetical protein
MNSLKTKLIDLIKSRKGQTVSINEIEYLCKQEQKKLSNAERRLRPSETPGLVRIRNEHGAIIGYAWNVKKSCCASFEIFGEHARDCYTLKINQLNI